MSDIDDDDRLISSVVFPRKLLKNFMIMYKGMPCLWDRKCAAYKLKHKRHEAVTQLTQLVRRHDPTATRVHVLRKIESLRACVRREHKKVRDSRMKAKTADDVYKPNLWYYNMLSFLFGEEKDAYYYQGKNNEDNQNADSEEDQEVEDQGVEEDQYEHQESYNQRGPQFMFSSKGLGHHSPGMSSDASADTSHKPVYGHDNSMVEISEYPSKQYSGYDEGESKAKRLCTEVEDEYDAIGVNVAAKLRGLPSNMRILAEKLVNDVLFQAQINGLTPSTTITTPDPFKQDPL